MFLSACLLTAVALTIHLPTVQDEAIALSPHWSQGDRYVIEMLLEKKDVDGGKLLKNNGTRTLIDVEVLATNKKSFDVRWTWGASEMLTKLSGAQAVIVPAIMGLQRGMVTEFRTDKNGGWKGLSNAKTVQAFYKQSLARMQGQLVEAGVPAGQAEAISASMAGLTQVAVIHAASQQPIAPFYELGGLQLSVGAPRTVEIEEVFPGFETLLPFKRTHVLESFDPAKNLAVIHFDSRIDEKQAAPVLRTMLEGMGVPAVDIADYKIQVQQNSEVQFDTQLGLPLRVETIKVVTMGSLVQTTKTTYIRRPAQETGGR